MLPFQPSFGSSRLSRAAELKPLTAAPASAGARKTQLRSENVNITNFRNFPPDMGGLRSRPYQKNDQCPVEQKNWSVVRRTIGYLRYESPEAMAPLETIYADLRLYTIFFQTVLKLLSK